MYAKNAHQRLSIAAKIPKLRRCRKTSEKAAVNLPPSRFQARRPCLSVDGSSYIFPRYHALPPLNRKSDGLQVMPLLASATCCGSCCATCPPDNRPTHLAIIFEQVRNHLPQQALSVQGAPAAGADDLIPQFALSARRCARSTALPGARRLRGRRSDRDLCARGRRAGATATIVPRTRT